MPRRDDIHTILVIGSGPIVIGQACEFDYSGTQGIRTYDLTSTTLQGPKTIQMNFTQSTIFKMHQEESNIFGINL